VTVSEYATDTQKPDTHQTNAIGTGCRYGAEITLRRLTTNHLLVIHRCSTDLNHRKNRWFRLRDLHPMH